MFISQNPHILPIELLYKLTNGTFWFSLIIALAQMTIPFYFSYYMIKKIDSWKEKNEIKAQNVGA